MKKVKTVSEFSDQLKSVTNLFIETNENFKIFRHLALAGETDVEQYVKRMNGLFPYIQKMLWQLIVIKLNLLFQTSEKHSIIRLIKELKENHYDELSVTKEIMDKWEEELELKRDEIEDIRVQRNNYYAHISGKDVISNLTFLKIQELLDMTYKFINEMNITFFEKHLIRDIINSPVDNLKFILNTLTENKIEKEKGFISLAKKYHIED